MAAVEDVQQESVQAEVSNVTCNKLRNAIRRQTLTKLEEV